MTSNLVFLPALTGTACAQGMVRPSVIALFALSALYPRPVGGPLVSVSLRLLQEEGQDVFLLLDHAHFDIGCRWGLLVQEVILAGEKDVHSGPCDTQDISGVFVNVPLKVQDVLVGPRELPEWP